MFRATLLSLAAALTVAAAPASAATFLFGGATQNVSTLSLTVDGIDLTVTAAQFTAAPDTLTSLSQVTQNLLVSQTTPGIGVSGGGSSPQVDTNTASRREALVITADTAVSLSALTLSFIDVNDTLAIYGINADGSLTSLGYDGLIRTGLDGAATVTNSSANGGTSVLTLDDATSYFIGYLFTTRVGGELTYAGASGQGYRIDSLTLNAVPEPATWAMLIAGFGMVGVASRRRRSASVHA